jgi:hypothetical protein
VRLFHNQKKGLFDMEGLAAIWSDVDRLLNKPTLRKPINTHLCNNCNGVKVFTKEGMPVCSQCGCVEEHYVDDSPEAFVLYSGLKSGVFSRVSVSAMN